MTVCISPSFLPTERGRYRLASQNRILGTSPMFKNSSQICMKELPCGSGPSIPPQNRTLYFHKKADILKEDFFFIFLHGQNLSLEILHKKKCKNHTKNDIICGNNEEQTKDFLQSQENFARLHDHETVTFRNSAKR